MKICMIGSGYVGLVSGACFADMGNDVTCVDNNVEKIENLKKGIIPIFEPQLDTLITRNFEGGRINFTTDLAEAINNCLFVFIAVGTPPDEDGSADLSHVLSVAREIGKHMNSYKIIIDKSTVPVGTADKVREAVQSEINKRTDVNPATLEFDVVSNPEFLKEGAAIDDFMKPDRIVVGTDNVRTAELMKELYAPFIRTNRPLISMSIRSAEMTKYAANSLLATKISFMNEMSNLCELLGADINEVRKGVGSDTRIGNQFLFPGVGYGGSCFPKDVKALIKTAVDLNYEPLILNAVEERNALQKMVLVNKVVKRFGEDLSGKTFTCWGLSFKPNTDDIREAPALTVISELTKRGAKINAFDPEATKNTKEFFSNNKSIEYFQNNYDACKNSNALLIITEWGIFRNPDFERIHSLLINPVIFDGRNLYSPTEMNKYKFEHYAIGR